MMFLYDKYESRQFSSKRVMELILFISCLSGGWIGGAISMLMFNHKLNKSSFLFSMLLTICVDLYLTFQFSM